MALGIWYAGDIRNTLIGLWSAALRHDDSEWRRGYLAALNDCGLAFGVGPDAQPIRKEGAPQAITEGGG